ncbi:MAG: transcriptional regulator [Nitrospirota bacterium]|nr:transcriptional regulator [Nitrospirota bacterium]
MYRKDLARYLAGGPVSVHDLARQMQMKAKDLADDLVHLQKSLKHEGRALIVHPARCKGCGFTFGPQKLVKPGRCPHCKGTWISDPMVEVSGP